jgi:hypothetical protein
VRRVPHTPILRVGLSRGTVICPLLLIVLEGAIFTCLLYSKDILLYSDSDWRVAAPEFRKRLWVAHPCGFVSCKGGAAFR